MTSPISNRDLIRVSRSLAPDAYLRLGEKLGFSKVLLGHLRDSSEKACALNMLLLWRDEQDENANLREALAEKLLEAGLTDLSKMMKEGTLVSPTSPIPPIRLDSLPDPTKEVNSPTSFPLPDRQTERGGEDTEEPLDTKDENETFNHHHDQASPGSDEDLDGDKTAQTEDNAIGADILSEELAMSEKKDLGAELSISGVDPSPDKKAKGRPLTKRFPENPATTEENAIDDALEKCANITSETNLHSDSGSDTCAGEYNVLATVGVNETDEGDRSEAVAIGDTSHNDEPTNALSDHSTPDIPTVITDLETLEESSKADERHVLLDVQKNAQDSDQTTQAKETDCESIQIDMSASPLIENSTEQQPRPVPAKRLSLVGSAPTSTDQENISAIPTLASSSANHRPRVRAHSVDPPLPPKTQLPVSSRRASHAGDGKSNRAIYEEIPQPGPVPMTNTHDKPPVIGPDLPDRSASLQRRLVPSLPKSTLKRACGGPSFKLHFGLSEDVLTALASDVETELQMKTLATHLGCAVSDIHKYESSIQGSFGMTSETMREMLLNWRERTPAEDQTMLLKHALRRSDLTKLIDRHLKGPQRKRDISSAKLAKNFTVVQCREMLETVYKEGLCRSLETHDLVDKEDINTVVVHQLVKWGKNVTLEKIVLTGPVDEILRFKKDGALPYRVVLLGPSGVGKTAVVAKLAYYWAHRDKKSPLREVPLLFVLRMQAINSHASLGESIVSQLLGGAKELTAQAMDEFIEQYPSECMLILDGLDAYKGDIFSPRSGHIVRLLQNIQLKNCRVLITTCPHVQNFFDQEDLPNVYIKMELEGFTWEQSAGFIQDFFKDVQQSTELMTYLKAHNVIMEMVHIPLFCFLVCKLWKNNLLQIVKTEVEFFDSVNRLFIRLADDKGIIAPEDVDLERVVIALGEVALHGLLEDSKKRYFLPSDFKKVPNAFDKGLALGILTKIESDKHEGSKGGAIQFYHALAQYHSAAKFLSQDTHTKTLKLGKQSQREKLVRRMTKGNLLDYGPVLRMASQAGSQSLSLQILETVSTAESLEEGERSRMFLDCFHLMNDVSAALLAKRCFGTGAIKLTLPSFHTVGGFTRIPIAVKEQVKSLTILTNDLPRHVATSMGILLCSSCPGLLKLEVTKSLNAAHPVILCLARKLSVHSTPGGALFVLPELKFILDDLRLVTLTGCHLSAESAGALWTALDKCGQIDLLTIKNASIPTRALPPLGCVESLNVTLTSPVKAGTLEWLPSLLENTTRLRDAVITIEAPSAETRLPSIRGRHEQISIDGNKLQLVKVSADTMRVLSVLPTPLKTKIKSICVNDSDLNDHLSKALMEALHSFIRCDRFWSSSSTLSPDLTQFLAFTGSSEETHEAQPSIGHVGSLTGAVSSPLREEELERLTRDIKTYSTLKGVDLQIGVPHPIPGMGSKDLYPEFIHISEGNMEISNASSTTLEILRMLPGAFRINITTVYIKHTNLATDLHKPLWDLLQSMCILESVITDHCRLSSKVPHLRSVLELRLSTLPRDCLDWQWLGRVSFLEVLDLTFAARPSNTASTDEDGASGGSAARSVATVGSSEQLRYNLSHNRLVMSRMSACCLSVMLHLPDHIKNTLCHLRVGDTPLTVDILGHLSAVLKGYRHLAPLSLNILYQRPMKTECLLLPRSADPVTGS